MPISEILLDTEEGPKRVEFKNCDIVLNDRTFGRTVYRHSGYPEYLALDLAQQQVASSV